MASTAKHARDLLSATRKKGQKPQAVVVAKPPKKGLSPAKINNPALVQDISAVIRMKDDDTSLYNALATCYEGKFHRVIIIDSFHPVAAYQKDPTVRALRKNGVTVLCLLSDRHLLDKMKDDAFYVEVPPDFYTPAKYTETFIADSRVECKRTRFKRFAIEPTYMVPRAVAPEGSLPISRLFAWCENLFADTFLIILQFVFHWMGRISYSTFYRSTYMTATLLVKHADQITLPDEHSNGSDKQPAIYGDRSTVSIPPDARRGMGHFMYLAGRENVFFSVWMFIFAYAVLVSPQWWHVLWPFDLTTGAFDPMVTLKSILPIFTTWRWAVLFINAMLAITTKRRYFPSMTYGALNAMLTPFFVGPFIVAMVISKVFWTGTPDLPDKKFVIPSLLPPGGVFGNFKEIPEDDEVDDGIIFESEDDEEDEKTDEDGDTGGVTKDELLAALKLLKENRKQKKKKQKQEEDVEEDDEDEDEEEEEEEKEEEKKPKPKKRNKKKMPASTSPPPPLHTELEEGDEK